MDEIKPLDISKYLGKVRNRVSLIGIELEGGWKEFPAGEKFDRDMSVFRERTPEQRATVKRLRISRYGELPSGTMMPATMPIWMKRCYPQMVDDTCGLHMHMSFRSKKHYSLLMTPEYQKTVIVELKDWAVAEGIRESNPIWNRLGGANEFCNHEYWADMQVMCQKKDYDHFRKGNRYTAVAYRSGQTIEVRILPMFAGVEQSIRALRRIIDITNACLVVLANRQKVDLLEIDNLPLGGIVERDVVNL